MKLLPLASALMFSASLIPVAPASAQNTSAEVQRCQSTLDAAENLMVDGRRLWITNVFVRDVGEAYANYPYQSPVGLTIVMAGDSAPDMMSSPQLLTSITESITSSCSRVSLVRFAVAESDWTIDFGLIGNQVREFECVDPDGTNNPMQWGYSYCL